MVKFIFEIIQLSTRLKVFCDNKFYYDEMFTLQL